MNDATKAEIIEKYNAGQRFSYLAATYGIKQPVLREILGLPPVNDPRIKRHITPEKVRNVLLECSGSRMLAADLLGVSVSLIENRIKKGKAKGMVYPANGDDNNRTKRSRKLLTPGQWCEWEHQEGEMLLATVIWVGDGMTEIEVHDTERRITVPIDKVIWVPSLAMIEEQTDAMKAWWSDNEFYERAGIKLPDCEIVECQTDNMVADCVS